MSRGSVKIHTLLFKNSFIEIQFTSHTIHPLKSVHFNDFFVYQQVSIPIIIVTFSTVSSPFHCPLRPHPTPSSHSNRLSLRLLSA